MSGLGGPTSQPAAPRPPALAAAVWAACGGNRGEAVELLREAALALDTGWEDDEP